MKTDTDQFMLQSGHLEVGEGHHLYFEEYGKSDGVPVIFLHGGPGLGFTSFDRRFFDPSKYRVIFFDQRGAGRSRFDDARKGNTTEALIKDVGRIADRFELDHYHLFGGSWGSTLALLAALEEPERVKSLILRAFFPANRACTEMIIDTQTRSFAPDSFDTFISNVPQAYQDDIIGYFAQKMWSEDPMERDAYINEWNKYMIVLAYGPNHTMPASVTGMTDVMRRHSGLTAYFAANRFFMPDNYVLDHVNKIASVPVLLVHGMNDPLCPHGYAVDLASRFDNCRLELVQGGHSSMDPEIERVLHEFMRIL